MTSGLTRVPLDPLGGEQSYVLHQKKLTRETRLCCQKPCLKGLSEGQNKLAAKNGRYR